MKWWIACLALLLGAPLWAQEDAGARGDIASIRSYYEPEGDIYVGQTVRLWVELTGDGIVSSPPKYPELKVEGAIALLPEQLGVAFTDRGTGRAGLRQRYVIIPQRPGDLVVPELQIAVGFKTDAGEQDMMLTVQPAPIVSIFPTEMDGVGLFISSDDVKVTQKFDQDPTGLRAGDAIERQVTTVAGGTFALALPQIQFAEIDGAKLYPAQPQLSDVTNRGSYRATRIDAVTYVFEKPGSYVLPDISVRWWNPARQRAEETVLEALEVEIAPNPEFEAAQQALQQDQRKQELMERIIRVLDWIREHIVLLVVWAVAVYMAALVLRKFGPVVWSAAHNARQRALNSESHAFRRFQARCRMPDTPAARAAFWAWLGHFASKDSIATLSAFETLLKPEDRDVLHRFLAARPGTELDARRSVAAAVNLRRALLSQGAEPKIGATRSLNPRSSAT